ncbi:anaerobic ribonucleoside-triphosphate reductase activating protein [Patescibacteria group bacterium]|nr:anaerobic ribonucleoside-triphosphate reductase activating protein [Patescibacteria group bacterium]MBU1563683.1 anaerobic ribonucleoside-triphosphate reductase activating protein [Patescibacteria group bacterium]
MLIGGLQKSTLIDYPGKVAATIFTIGCNFKCPFCHNPELVDLKKIKRQPKIFEAVFFDFLKSRQDLLEGICITGGEPSIQPDIIDFIKKIKKLSFLVKLDTNGSQPKILEKLFNQNLLDFVAMDIKSSQENYSKTAGIKINPQDIQKSIDLIRENKIDYEFRTTIAPGLINNEEIKKIGQWLKGSKKFALQQFRPEKTLDQSWQKSRPLLDEELKQMSKIAQKYFEQVELRGI